MTDRPSPMPLRPTALGVFVFLASATAGAQTGITDPVPETALPEVRVTAERAERPLRKTPVSVGVVDGARIEQYGLYQLSDLVGTVAGVSVPNAASNMPQAVGIRGVGLSLPAMAQAVGIYVDDVPLVRGYANTAWDLPDIERIEVLRGPQGTLYGQNSTAGAVKYISIDPSADTNAWLSFGAGNHGAMEVHGYANGAIGDGPLSASLAYSRRLNDGFGYNATRNVPVNRTDITQFRAKFRLAPSPTFDAILAVDGLHDGSDTNTANFPIGQTYSAPRVNHVASDAGAFERKAGGVSLRLENRIHSRLKFRSITGYRFFKDDPLIADWGGLAQLQYQISQIGEQKVFSQEFQLQGSDEHTTWTTGLMYIGDQFDFARYVDVARPAPAPVAHTEAQTGQKTRDVGLYGQLRHALTPATGVTGGLRLYHTSQDARNAFWRTDAQRTRTDTVYESDGLSTSRSGLLPRLGIDHQWSPELFLYASLAQGAKFGGFNRAAESALSAQVASDPEKVTTLELGGKGRFLDGMLDANVALFYNDFRDYLAAVNGAVVNGVLVTDSVLINAGKATTYGVDAELTARLNPRLDLGVSLELLRSRFDEFANPSGAQATDYVGNELPNAPHVTVGANVSYRHPFENGGSAVLYAMAQHLASQFTDIANSPETRVPAQTYVHVGASYTEPGQHWSFSMRVRNLFDKAYVIQHIRIPPLGVHGGYYSTPRTVLFTAKYEY